MQRPSVPVGAALVVLCPTAAYIAVQHPRVAVLLALVGVLGLVAAPLLSAHRISIERPDSAPPAPELLVLPLLLEGQVFNHRVAIVALAGLAAYMVLTTASRKGPAVWLVAALVASFGIPLTRPIDVEQHFYTWLVPLLALIIFVMSARRRSYHTYVSSLLDGIGLYLILNVLAHWAGVVSPNAADRTGALEAAGGGVRVIFPITNSLAIPPTMAALYVAGAFLCLERTSPGRRAARLVAFGAACLILVQTDTRAVMLAGVALLTLCILSVRLLARIAVPLTVAAIAFVFVFGLIQSVVRGALAVLFALTPGLSRGDEAGDLTLSYRALIWERTRGFWIDNADAVGALFGYGVRGQQQSGASTTYVRDVSGISSNPLAVSVHNSYLQQLYDAGIIGLVLLVVVLLWTVRRAARDVTLARPGSQIALPVILAGIIGGMTEVSMAPGYLQAPVYMVVGIAIAIGTARRESPGLSSDDREAVPTATRDSGRT